MSDTGQTEFPRHPEIARLEAENAGLRAVVDKLPSPTIKLLPSGYWLVRWNQNLWVQWPTGREPQMGDGFGWFSQKMLNEAKEMAAAEAARQKGTKEHD